MNKYLYYWDYLNGLSPTENKYPINQNTMRLYLGSDLIASTSFDSDFDYKITNTYDKSNGSFFANVMKKFSEGTVAGAQIGGGLMQILAEAIGRVNNATGGNIKPIKTLDDITKSDKFKEVERKALEYGSTVVEMPWESSQVYKSTSNDISIPQFTMQLLSSKGLSDFLIKNHLYSGYYNGKNTSAKETVTSIARYKLNKSLNDFTKRHWSGIATEDSAKKESLIKEYKSLETGKKNVVTLDQWLEYEISSKSDFEQISSGDDERNYRKNNQGGEENGLEEKSSWPIQTYNGIPLMKLEDAKKKPVLTYVNFIRLLLGGTVTDGGAGTGGRISFKPPMGVNPFILSPSSVTVESELHEMLVLRIGPQDGVTKNIPNLFPQGVNIKLSKEKTDTGDHLWATITIDLIPGKRFGSKLLGTMIDESRGEI